ncbi:hypothetical protein JJJ17_09440 [Paracoccus caeni]|uniref:ParB/Sulfiredoxin domain-containing protein n=1 Tax=Paracoccus caeni TaxID=657651 RepID=A0A934SKM8_9RHOB|nr:hypothetical protein [Paracoccus caeni]MBK4216148.1 hypothetical protein [Paracoccus caeni]
MRGPLAVDLRSIEVPLSQLFLDPNNPRFVGSEWVYISDDDAVKSDIQESTSDRLFSEHDVDKLKSIMEYNGYLPIDRVVVRKISEDAYIVLEGNRRICAAKSINGHSDSGDPLPVAIVETFKKIPCLLYEGANEDGDASWIFQGLRHISGISEWPAFNKAKLIVEQMESRELSFTEVGKGFGLSAFGAAQWVRGYYAFQQAKDETEFGRYIDEKIYPFFQELFGRSSIALKEWLRWSEDEKKFQDAANLNEFVSWFYPVERAEDDDGVDREPSKAEVNEAWGRRRISKRDDLRSVTYLIQKSSKNWMEFRSGTDIDKSYNRALLDELEHDRDEEKNAVEKFFSILDEADKQLRDTPLSVLSDDGNKERLNVILASLRQTEEKIRGLLNK